MPRSTLTEARPTARARLLEAGAPGTFRIELITPGWGTSGYYPREVLEAAGNAGVFPAGLHMYLDHPTASDKVERPERSVRDLAAVLAETAVWDPAAGDGTGGLVADCHVFGAHRDVLTEMAENIGVSVIALADVETGDAEGRRGRIVRELVEGKSVDFVTQAGRGGRIVEILESAREVTEGRNIGQWLESRLHRDFTILTDDMFGDGRLTREERISLSSAIGDALTAFVARIEADQPQLYTRDLWDEPDDTVADAIEGRSPAVVDAVLSRLLKAAPLQADTRRGRAVAHWVNDAAEALSLTNVPVTRPGHTTTEESEEDTMPEIEAARLRELEEAHGRVPTLESERTAAVERATTAEAAQATAETELARERARTAAVTHVRSRVTEANADLVPATVDRIVATATGTVPLTESGQLDTAALDTAADTARTAEETYLAGLAESGGAGTPRWLGRHTTKPAGAVTEADVMARIKARAGTTTKEA